MPNIANRTTSGHPPIRILLILAGLFLLRGIWITWPERAVATWSQPPLVQSLIMDPTGRVVMTDGTAARWYQLLTGTTDDTLTTVDGAGDLRSWALSRDGQWLAFSRTSGDVTIWSVATKQLVAHRQLSAPTMAEQLGSSVLFSPDGQTVAWTGLYQSQAPTNQLTNRLELWDRTTQAVIWSQEWVYALPGSTADMGPDQILFSPDGQFILLVGQALEVLQVATHTRTYRIKLDPCCEGAYAVISPDQQWFASSQRGQVTIRRFSDGTLVRVLAGSPDDASVLAFRPDSRYLAVGPNTTRSSGFMVSIPNVTDTLPVTLWQVADWRSVQTFQGHLEGARGMAYSPGGQYLVTYGSDFRDLAIRVWRVSPHHPFEPSFWLGGGLTLLIAAVGRWIGQRRTPRA